jgi:hypothetical protein
MKNFQKTSSKKRDLNREFITTHAEGGEYTQEATNHSGAQRLLADLKSRDTHNELSKIVWKDRQPTLVTTTRPNFRVLADLEDLSDGGPATDSTERVPSSWEAKRDARDRRSFTLEETPVMAFKSSGQLPAHYYMDETALEAYVQSLTNE